MSHDSKAKSPKLNQRLMSAPAGAVLTSAWLRQQGISTRLADYYARSGWLHRIGDGAFTVLPESPSWLGAVFGLQGKSKSFHPGGRTALELSGFAHFLPLGNHYPVYLFSRAGDRLPAWFQGLPWASRVRHMRTDFLPVDAGWREHDAGAFGVTISAPERAALEFLHQLTPDTAAYEHASLVFEGLGTLRPDVVQQLLESCTSIKVKRLFLHLAERHGHAWFKQLEVTKVDLGSGKRALIPGGRLDPKYLITVPVVTEAPDDAP
jgi:Protein of unknwon function (DUF2893).